MNINKISAYIGFAIRKGAVVYGLDALETYRKKYYLIICSSSLTENSLKKAQACADNKGCSLVKLDNLEDVLKRNCKVLTICDKSLADAIKNNLL